MTPEEAERIATEHLGRVYEGTEPDVVIVAGSRLEVEDGFMFFYNTRAAAAGDLTAEANPLCGNVPIVVTAPAGEVRYATNEEAARYRDHPLPYVPPAIILL